MAALDAPVAVTDVGAPGVVAGTSALVADVYVPVPLAFAAATLNT